MSSYQMLSRLFQSLQYKGFNLEYLAKVAEVKDTVHKHSLLYHLCMMVVEQFPDSTDLHSEIGSVSRCARVCILCQTMFPIDF